MIFKFLDNYIDTTNSLYVNSLGAILAVEQEQDGAWHQTSGSVHSFAGI